MVQLRYAAGVKDMLERYFKGEDFPEQNYIVKEGKLASQYVWGYFPTYGRETSTRHVFVVVNKGHAYLWGMVSYVWNHCS